jgi:hypothetical protein
MVATTILARLATTLVAAAVSAGADDGAGAQPGADEASQYRLEAFRWSGALERGATLVARNDYGGLHVQESADGTLLVSAMIQKIGGGAEELAVDVRPGEAGVEIDVQALVAEPRGRVDVTLMVPDGRAVDVATTDGDIRIQEYGGPVRARSARGSISAMRVRALDARADAGGVSVALHGRRFRAPILLSGAGDVEVLVNEEADLDLAAMGERVEVSLPAGRLHEVREGGGRYEARFGAGGASLRAMSFSGLVRIGPLE